MAAATFAAVAAFQVIGFRKNHKSVLPIIIGLLILVLYLRLIIRLHQKE